MTREDLLAWREKLMKGDPPYQIHPVTGTKFRGGSIRRIEEAAIVVPGGGMRGIEEMREQGSTDPIMPTILALMELAVALIDDRLERMRKPS